MLPQMMSGGLRSRLALLVLVTLLPILVASIVLGLRQRQAALDAFVAHSQQTTQSVAADLDRVIGVAHQVLQNAPALVDPQTDPAGCTATLDTFRTILPSLTTIALVTPTGEPLCATSGAPAQPAQATAAWFVRAAQTQDLTMSEGPGDASGPGLYLGHGFRAADGSVGVAYATFSLAWMDRTLKAAELPEGGVANVFTADGHLLYRSAMSEAFVGRVIDPTTMERLQAASARGLETAGMDGTRRLYTSASWASAAGTPLILAIGYPAESVRRPFNQTILVQSLILLASLLVALLAVNRLARRLVLQPAEALVAATARVRSGDLRAHVPEIGGAELQQLASAFNLTIDTLRETESLQAQLRHAQRLQAVGQLAGGIAHEFNNMLQVILGHSELLLEEQRDNPSFNAIQAAARRSQALTQQLLAFGRRQVLQPRRANLDDLVRDGLHALTPMLGEQILLELRLGAQPNQVLVDPVQFEHVLLNVLINAKEAMPRGGRLTIATAPVGVRTGSVGELPEGHYVELSIQDTGEGMTEEVRARALEPFFTTKGFGQRSGLGLSTAYGIVRQSGGDLTLASQPGAGTTARIYLPIVI